MRDEFSRKTREKLAQRAGYRCSKPECRISTRGADSTSDGAIDIGVGAHITAASPGGPRFDPLLDSIERSGISNGIWLCQNHAKLVDSDDSVFTTEELLKWKVASELASFLEVSSAGIQANSEAVGQHALGSDNLQEMVLQDLRGFRRTSSWPTHAVHLGLQLLHKGTETLFTVAGLAAALITFDEIILVAEPGTGKTTTLLQLGEALVDSHGLVTCFVPLSEWATRQERILESIAQRRAFSEIAASHLGAEAQQGRLLLLLDGWNELDVRSRSRVRAELKELRRDFPDIRTIMSSRSVEQDLPSTGPQVRLKQLTVAQQREIARAHRGVQGEALLDRAWRTPGLRELVAIPLYLSVFLEQVAGGTFPTTKEELLEAFVARHENQHDRAAVLANDLQGLHRPLLGRLASELTKRSTTSLGEADARAVISAAQNDLCAKGQLSDPLPPHRVLELLTGVHLLVRTGESVAAFRFQHQQFQEWFTSIWVEELMVSAMGAPDLKRVLRMEVLNFPFWEEAIVFACERLSHLNQVGATVVAETIATTLSIDPLLSAEIIYRSSAQAWEAVRDRVAEFAARWHSGTRVDRAFQFMVNTGKAEFASFIWPLVSDPDSQVHLRALRAGRRFRVGVLGANPEVRIKAMPDELRRHVIAEIANEGGAEALELAASLAATDLSAAVQLSVIEILQFRGADHLTSSLLHSASAAVLEGIAGHFDAEEFGDPDIQRLIASVQQRVETGGRPGKAIDRLLRHRAHEPNAESEVQELVAKMDFSGAPGDDSLAFQRAYDAFPSASVRGLVELLRNGGRLPFRAHELLASFPQEIDAGPVVARLLGPGSHESDQAAASVAGPRTVRLLIERYLALVHSTREMGRSHGEIARRDSNRLLGLLSVTKPNRLVDALSMMEPANDPFTIGVLADLIAGHGRVYERPLFDVDDARSRVLAKILNDWSDVMIGSSGGSRGEMAIVTRAICRLGSSETLSALARLLAEDLKRWGAERLARAEAQHRNRIIQNEAAMNYSGQYCDAFVSIGDHATTDLMKGYLANTQFGVEAAQVLQRVWNEEQGGQDIRVAGGPSPDFSGVHMARSLKEGRTNGHPFADAIFRTAERFVDPTPDHRRHALGLACAGVGLPYVDSIGVVPKLLGLAIPAAEKLRLLTMLSLAGEVIPSSLLTQGVNELLESAATNPWLLRDNGSNWRIIEWLRLFPFSDNPLALIDALDRFAYWSKPAYEARPLLIVLRSSPCASDAIRILLHLVAKNPKYLHEHEWLVAFTQLQSPSAAQSLGELVCNPELIEAVPNGETRGLIHALASMIRAYPSFREFVVARYTTLSEPRSLAILEHALAEAADEDMFFLLLRKAADRRQTLRQTVLYDSLKRLLIGSRRQSTSSAIVEYYGMPAAGVRKRLFGLFVAGPGATSNLAKECLLAADEIQDFYGYVENEPRHPDIESGAPWPSI